MTEIAFLSSRSDGCAVFEMRAAGAGSPAAVPAISAGGSGSMYAPRNVYPRPRSGELDG
jgi:hypothetical protein